MPMYKRKLVVAGSVIGLNLASPVLIPYAVGTLIMAYFDVYFWCEMLVGCATGCIALHKKMSECERDGVV